MKIDDRISDAALLREIVDRSIELARGLVRVRSRVFLGRGVSLRARSRIRLGKYSTVGERSRLDGLSERGIVIGRASKLGRYVTVVGTSQFGLMGVGLLVGDRCGVGDFAHVGCSGGVQIGDDVIIGPYSSFHSQEHLYDDPKLPIREQGTRQEPIIIEDDVWVGARATFLAGAHVRSGSIVAAGAVVRGSFPPNVIIGGIPARVLKERSADVGAP